MVGHRQVDGVAIVANHRHGGAHRVGGSIRGRGGRRQHYPTRPSVGVVGRSRGGNISRNVLCAIGRTHSRDGRNRRHRIRMHSDGDILVGRLTLRLRLVAGGYNIIYIAVLVRRGNVARDGGVEVVRARVGQTANQTQGRGQCAVHAGERNLLDSAARTDFLRKRGHRQLHGRVHLDGTGDRDRVTHWVSLVGGGFDGIFKCARLGRSTGNGLRRRIEGHTRGQHTCRLADGCILDIKDNVRQR